MIRNYTETDLAALLRVHAHNELPETCMPNPKDPLFFIKKVLEVDGKPAMAGFLKLTAEAYLLLDKTVGTPESRWTNLQKLEEAIEAEAYFKGLDDFTAWVPPSLDASFGKRLEQLGLLKSPWQAYTRVLR